MWGRLALVVRKESNFDPVLCGLSLLVFPESVAGPYQYFLASDHGGRPIRRSRSVAHVLGKLQIECVYLLIADVTHHKR